MDGGADWMNWRERGGGGRSDYQRIAHAIPGCSRVPL